jgi:hypothetical protein
LLVSAEPVVSQQNTFGQGLCRFFRRDAREMRQADPQGPGFGSFTGFGDISPPFAQGFQKPGNRFVRVGHVQSQNQDPFSPGFFLPVFRARVIQELVFVLAGKVLQGKGMGHLGLNRRITGRGVVFAVKGKIHCEIGIDRIYRFFSNGQSGMFHGKSPLVRIKCPYV